MNRRAFGAAMVIALLLPGVWLLDGTSVTIPAELAIGTEGPYELYLSEWLFAGIPTLFVIAMVVEAMGHIRERKPPS